MARIRSIKEDVFHDDTLADVSIEAHMLLVGLPVWADSAGRLEDRPRKISARVFPYRQTIDVNACLVELVRSGHVIRYEVAGEQYIQIVDWEKDQRPHVKEPESIIPPPPQNNTEHRKAPATTGRQPGDITTQHAGIKDSGSGVLDSGLRDLPPPAVASAASGQGELLPDTAPTPPAKPSKKAKEAKKSPPDAPEPKPFTATCDMLTLVYAEVRKADYGFGLNATRNGKAVRELLWGDGAKGVGRGEPLVPLEEIERRWRIGLAWKGFPACNAIWDLREHWAAYAQPQDGRAAPDNLRSAQPGTCAGCGTRCQGGAVGEPEVWLGYECGCLPAFTEAQSQGLHFTKAAEWAATRKRAA